MPVCVYMCKKEKHTEKTGTDPNTGTEKGVREEQKTEKKRRWKRIMGKREL